MRPAAARGPNGGMAGQTPGSSGLQRNVDAIAKVEAAIVGERSPGERLGRFLIRHLGAPVSVAIHLALFLGWILVNSGAVPGLPSLDPPPFPLLELFATIEAIILGLLILVSQNRLQHEGDRRAHLSLQINMMAEAEATEMLHMLDRLCGHFGIEAAHDGVIDELKNETDPGHIAESLKRTMPSE